MTSILTIPPARARSKIFQVMEDLAVTTALHLIIRVYLWRISLSLREKSDIHQPKSIRIGEK